MKKGFLTLLVFAVTLTLSFGFLADSADAKRGGGLKSNKQSFTQQNNTQKTDNTSATQTNKATTTPNSTQTTKQGGLFSGSGGFLKGMAIGGLAGLLFGSMFGNMGAFGEILGFLVNSLMIFGIVMVVIALFKYIRNGRKPASNGPNYNRYNEYNRNNDYSRNNDENNDNKR